MNYLEGIWFLFIAHDILLCFYKENGTSNLFFYGKAFLGR